ncbi:hypothetical protein SADUNF_Sadunf06G0176800 [Salix dunnii]|uniref:Uncharacterized protein n=1 Tax=Salix dunnii TaxID=1413687 RepID=A0A835K9X1_9ROSI|nr:hypothetical protein SADUNF_Sadunf06G0176800 [Salix dunnii]
MPLMSSGFAVTSAKSGSMENVLRSPQRGLSILSSTNAHLAATKEHGLDDVWSLLSANYAWWHLGTPVLSIAIAGFDLFLIVPASSLNVTWPYSLERELVYLKRCSEGASLQKKNHQQLRVANNSVINVPKSRWPELSEELEEKQVAKEPQSFRLSIPRSRYELHRCMAHRLELLRHRLEPGYRRAESRRLHKCES